MVHLLRTDDPAPVHNAGPQDALVFVEFQREWLDPVVGRLHGLMRDRDQFERSVVAARRLIDGARASAAPPRIVHVPCLFGAGYPEIGGGLARGLFAAIPKAGTWVDPEARAFAPGFEPRAGEFVVGGRVGASAFANSNLDLHLHALGVRRLYLAGYALHVCIESTLRQGHDLGYDMVVVADACAAFTAEQRRHVLDEVVHHFGEATTADDLIATFAQQDAAS